MQLFAVWSAKLYCCFFFFFLLKTVHAALFDIMKQFFLKYYINVACVHQGWQIVAWQQDVFFPRFLNIELKLIHLFKPFLPRKFAGVLEEQQIIRILIFNRNHFTDKLLGFQFHLDDLSRSSPWSQQLLLCFSFCRWLDVLPQFLPAHDDTNTRGFVCVPLIYLYFFSTGQLRSRKSERQWCIKAGHEFLCYHLCNSSTAWRSTSMEPRPNLIFSSTQIATMYLLCKVTMWQALSVLQHLEGQFKDGLDHWKWGSMKRI